MEFIMPKLENLEGQIFESLTVIEFSHMDKARQSFWICICACGSLSVVARNNLKRGKVKSCGCTRHGLCESELYSIWRGMVQRCTNPNHISWKYYGARGIKVCDDWFKFINFYNDMQPKPLGLSLDRRDNDLGYNKENCRWVTFVEQANNKRQRS
jgi:hypothetical protein